MELKRELSMQYSVIPMESHVTQAFTQLEQGPDELLDRYLHCTSELLSKIYHISDISKLLAESFNHYAVVYGLHHSKLKDSFMGHHNVQWKTMEDCLKDIHNIGTGYERAIGYCRSESNTQNVSSIIEDKTMKKSGTCYKCRGPHFQHNCTHIMKNSINKFEAKNPHTTKPQWKQQQEEQQQHIPHRNPFIPGIPTN